MTEDSQEVRRFIREILTKKGYAVIEAFDGEQAVQKYREYQKDIDLLLLDVVMPKKNGQEVYEEIRTIHSCAASH